MLELLHLFIRVRRTQAYKRQSAFWIIHNAMPECNRTERRERHPVLLALCEISTVFWLQKNSNRRKEGKCKEKEKK